MNADTLRRWRDELDDAQLILRGRPGAHEKQLALSRVDVVSAEITGAYLDAVERETDAPVQHRVDACNCARST